MVYMKTILVPAVWDNEDLIQDGDSQCQHQRIIIGPINNYLKGEHETQPNISCEA